MSTIAVLKERREGEARVAASPDSIKKFVQAGMRVVVESGAGEASSISDSDYTVAGAEIASSAPAALSGASVLIAVQCPSPEHLAALPEGALVVGSLNPAANADAVKTIHQKKLSAFTLERVPRITRAQSMDVLSSQANLAGYRAVIEAVAHYGRVVPMFMTAAGTVPPARALILGAGVAGLQAIATARRLGAVVSAFDVRPAAREQVESLGATFVEVPSEETANAETAGGYAKEMSEEYKQKQRVLLHETIKKQDIVITTALIPNKPAPVLITEEMVKDMKAGAVIIDLAAIAGGNCPLTKLDEAVKVGGVTILGPSNLPSLVAADASRLYARNVQEFLGLLWNKESKRFEIKDDEILKASLIQGEAA